MYPELYRVLLTHKPLRWLFGLLVVLFVAPMFIPTWAPTACEDEDEVALLEEVLAEERKSLNQIQRIANNLREYRGKYEDLETQVQERLWVFARSDISSEHIEEVTGDAAVRILRNDEAGRWTISFAGEGGAEEVSEILGVLEQRMPGLVLQELSLGREGASWSVEASAPIIPLLAEGELPEFDEPTLPEISWRSSTRARNLRRQIRSDRQEIHHLSEIVGRASNYREVVVRIRAWINETESAWKVKSGAGVADAFLLKDDAPLKSGRIVFDAGGVSVSGGVAAGDDVSVERLTNVLGDGWRVKDLREAEPITFIASLEEEA